MLNSKFKINYFLMIGMFFLIGCGENNTSTKEIPISNKSIVMKKQESETIKSSISTLSWAYYTDESSKRWYISPVNSTNKVVVYSLMGFKDGKNGWGTVAKDVASFDLYNETISIDYINDNYEYKYFDAGWNEWTVDVQIQKDIEYIRDSTVSIKWWFFQASNGSWYIINRVGNTWRFSSKIKDGERIYDWIKIDMGGDTPTFFVENGVKKMKFLSTTEPSTDTKLIGIDVSKHNGSINWSLVKNDNIAFAFIKATEGYPESDYEKSHEITMRFVDSKFKENMDSAINAGLLVAPYHFIRVDYNNKISEAKESARYFVSKIKPYYDNYQMLPPVIDLENPLYSKENSSNRNQIGRWSKKEFSDWIRAFASEIESALGRKPILYMNESFSDSEVDQSIINNYKLWIAKYMFSASSGTVINSLDDLHQYDENFKPNKKFTFWQFSETSTDVDGLGSYVDKDVFYGSLSELKSL